MFDTKGHRFSRDFIMLKVRWALSYKLSYRDLEEMAAERGVEVDHSSINRWVLKFSPGLEEEIRKYKKRVGKTWRMDETYIKVKGKWKYLYRAVDKDGNTVDYLLTAKRDRRAAKRFFTKAIGSNGKPNTINIDKSGANTAGINDYNKQHKIDIKIRRVKYLNNIVEQDHRRVKGLYKATLGFQSFKTAQITLGGMEAMQMLKKNQIKAGGKTPVQNFFALTP